MRQSIMMSLGILWALSVAGCAPNAIPGSANHGVRAVRAGVRPDARVLLLVMNRRAEAAGLYVLRAGHAPTFVGVAEPGARAAFDVTAAAPEGARVRFAALGRRAGDHLLTEEVAILRGGTVVIEIDPAPPLSARGTASRVRPAAG